MVLLSDFAFKTNGLLLTTTEIFKPVTFYFTKSISHLDPFHIRTRHKINLMNMVWQQGGSDENKSLELLAETNNFESGINISNPL